jgi:fructose-1,6-bisphosphatase I
MTSRLTIERHILEQQQHFPAATGAFSALLHDIALAAKFINREVTHAALVNALGFVGSSNVHGEAQQKLDVYADETLINILNPSGRVCVMASEEHEELIAVPESHFGGKYALVFDPLDGSSNLNVNVGVGTIFGLYRKVSSGVYGSLEDVLQPGNRLLAAGYILYGPSTMLVYTTGQGVFGFTLDVTLGEFFLSHPSIRIPDHSSYYSVNQGRQRYWSAGVRKYVEWLQGLDDDTRPHVDTRYTGSLVVDFHRNLINGGVFLYPGDMQKPSNLKGKMRLIYEANPLAFIAQQAGGYASDGVQDILSITPTTLHQRVPLFIGNRDLVKQAERFIATHDKAWIAAYQQPANA